MSKSKKDGGVEFVRELPPIAALSMQPGDRPQCLVVTGDGEYFVVQTHEAKTWNGRELIPSVTEVYRSNKDGDFVRYGTTAKGRDRRSAIEALTKLVATPLYAVRQVLES